MALRMTTSSSIGLQLHHGSYLRRIGMAALPKCIMHLPHKRTGKSACRRFACIAANALTQSRTRERGYSGSNRFFFVVAGCAPPRRRLPVPRHRTHHVLAISGRDTGDVVFPRGRCHRGCRKHQHLCRGLHRQVLRPHRKRVRPFLSGAGRGSRSEIPPRHSQRGRQPARPPQQSTAVACCRRIAKERHRPRLQSRQFLLARRHE